MTAAEVRHVVSDTLDKHGRDGGLHIVGTPELRDGQWQILIEPFGWEPSPRLNYYEMLSNVEDEISDLTGLSIFLTPAPEATFRYQAGEVKIDVARRDSFLFVRPSGSTEFYATYSLDGRLEGCVPGDVDRAGARKVEEYWLSSFADAVRQYLADQKGLDEREKALSHNTR